MVPGRRPLIAIGYNYNAWKVLYFTVTDNAWSTHKDLPHVFMYPDQFTNVSIHPVAHSLFTSKLFGAVNEVDS